MNKTSLFEKGRELLGSSDFSIGIIGIILFAFQVWAPAPQREIHARSEVRTGSGIITGSNQLRRCQSALRNPLLPEERARWPIMPQSSTQPGTHKHGNSLVRSPTLRQQSAINKERAYGAIPFLLDGAYVLIIF